MRKTSLLLILFLFIFFDGFSQNWLTDFSEAQKLSLEQQKKIILVFSGSDWCGPCIKLDTQIWQSQEFKEYSENYFILLKADFPRKKRINFQKNSKNTTIFWQKNTKQDFL